MRVSSVMFQVCSRLLLVDRGAKPVSWLVSTVSPRGRGGRPATERPTAEQGAVGQGRSVRRSTTQAWMSASVRVTGPDAHAAASTTTRLTLPTASAS